MYIYAYDTYRSGISVRNFSADKLMPESAVKDLTVSTTERTYIQRKNVIYLCIYTCPAKPLRNVLTSS